MNRSPTLFFSVDESDENTLIIYLLYSRRAIPSSNALEMRRRLQWLQWL